MENEMKVCPVCGELIKKEEIICPYCHESISGEKKNNSLDNEWEKKDSSINKKDSYLMENEMKVCPVCGELIEKEETICPYCHENISGEKKNIPFDNEGEKKDSSIKKASYLYWVFGGIVLLGLLLFLVMIISGTDGNDDFSGNNMEYTETASNSDGASNMEHEIDELENTSEEIESLHLQRIAIFGEKIGNVSYYYLSPDERDHYANKLYMQKGNDRKKIDLDGLEIGDKTLLVSSVNDFAVQSGNIYFIGNYDGCGAFSGQYVFYYNMAEEKFYYFGFFSVAEFVYSHRRLKVTEQRLVKKGSCSAEDEYEFTDTYYNL